MASLIHWTLADPHWVLPRPQHDPARRAVLPRLRQPAGRHLSPARGARDRRHDGLYPSREDAELNARALETLERDKRNEAACLMDGAKCGTGPQ